MSDLPKIADDHARSLITAETKRIIGKNVPDNLLCIAEELERIRQIIDDTIKFIDGSKEGFNASMKSYLNDLRATRMTSINEVNQMLGTLKEIRQFFVGPDYEPQIKRLREFVELCERLEALKNRGTLDALADTMLKLAVQPEL